MKTINPTIARGAANYNCNYNKCLQVSVHADKGIGDEYSVTTVKRSNIITQTVHESCSATTAKKIQKKIIPVPIISPLTHYHFLLYIYRIYR
jgi:hypothetical protein